MSETFLSSSPGTEGSVGSGIGNVPAAGFVMIHAIAKTENARTPPPCMTQSNRVILSSL